MKKITIISGSTLGGAEYVAEHCEDLLQQYEFDTALLHGPQLSDIEDQTLWLIVTSTHGAGDLPDNLQPFFDDLNSSSYPLDKLSYAIIGLGSSDYDTYCFATNKVDQILQNKGANKLLDTLKIDTVKVNDPELEAEIWIPTLINCLKNS